MLTVKEIAVIWGESEEYVTRQCRNGKVPGAQKSRKEWLIPDGALKPMDGRRKKSTQPELRPTVSRKPLPIGISDYRLASRNYYYVDKTLLIRDFLDERPMVSLFTRPRRFGKTLTMDMLRTFFEKTDEDTSVYFLDKKIWACGKTYQEYQGKYPVIFLTFKDVKCESWEDTYEYLIRLITQEYRRHSELRENLSLSNHDAYERIADGNAAASDYMMSLQLLSQMLDEHYGIAPIIIIDEYDTPIQQGHAKGFYDKVILFMRNLFSGGLKDNPHLSYGFLTGILRVAKESIFSGLNNLKINSILDDQYSQYFGFTKEEVKQIAAAYGASKKYTEIAEWYDGYRFGQTEIFNPWSVINYFSNGCQPRAYWQSTGSNEIIGEVLSQADEKIYEQLQKLMNGQSVPAVIDTSVIYPQVQSQPSSIYSFLLMAGYLKAIDSDSTFGTDYLCKVQIPNKELSFVYQKEILDQMQDIFSPTISASIQEALYTQDAELLKEKLESFLLQTVSSFDTAKETFYHGLVLGLCAMMQSRYYISSNRESGLGRFDIQLCPKEKYQETLPAVLIELKAEKSKTSDQLKELAQTALEQIREKKYDTDLLSKGIATIYHFGVAFSGKAVEVAAD